MKVSVKQNGLLSLIIDSGRKGRQIHGFSQSGPMDEEAYWWANYLVANGSDTPAIECMGRCALLFSNNGHVAVTGRNVSVMINHQTQGPFETLKVKAGDTLVVDSEFLGSKTYIAIGGKWSVPTPLDSACTVTRENIGGLRNDGTGLIDGDVIDITPHSQPIPHHAIASAFQPCYDISKPIGLIPSYQYTEFSELARAQFVAHEYCVSSNINRMGYRLSGTAITSAVTQMRSEGIHSGAVQIPPDGQPIVMMRDRQTLGGYPKIGSVNPLDINRLAQSVPGETLRFVYQDSDNARAEYLLNWHKRLRITGAQQ